MTAFGTEHAGLQSDSVAPAGLGATINIGSAAGEIPIRTLAEPMMEIVRQVTGRRVRLSHGPATSSSSTHRCPDMTEAIEIAGFALRISRGDVLARTLPGIAGGCLKVAR